MFQHVTTLFSFIFAVALTHVFSGASKLILARHRVHFSGLLALWMVSAAAGLLNDWLSLAELEGIKHWSVFEILLQLGWVIPQYFTCSLIAMPVHAEGIVDMQAFFERQRRVIFVAFILTYVMAMLENYADRNNNTGWKPDDWIGADLVVLPMLIAAIVAGWSKSRALQWAACVITLVLQAWFLGASYVVAN